METCPPFEKKAVIGETIVLADKLPDLVAPLVAKNNRIFWQDGTGYYSTNYDYENKKFK